MKKEIQQGLQSLDSGLLGGSVDETIKFLSKLRRQYKKQGFYNLFVEYEMSYGEVVGASLMGTRLETDEEYACRVAKEEKRKLKKELKKQEMEIK